MHDLTILFDLSPTCLACAYIASRFRFVMFDITSAWASLNSKSLDFLGGGMESCGMLACFGLG